MQDETVPILNPTLGRESGTVRLTKLYLDQATPLSHGKRLNVLL